MGSSPAEGRSPVAPAPTSLSLETWVRAVRHRRLRHRLLTIGLGAMGGVLVLVLFTVMMTRVPQNEKRRRGLDRYVPAAVFAALVFAVLYKVVTAVQWNGTATVAEPTVAEIGTNLMTNFIFPFEYVSLVLLASMIGAAILIRESKLPDTESEEETEVQS